MSVRVARDERKRDGFPRKMWWVWRGEGVCRGGEMRRKGEKDMVEFFENGQVEFV